MATPVVMPKLGNSVESSIIVNWVKKKGDKVAEGETLCEVETDKATLEVESPASGTLLELFFDEGDDVPVMVTIAAIGEPGEDADGLRPERSESVPTAEAPAPNGREAAPTEAPSAAPLERSADDELAIRISPRARKLAQRKGLSLGDVAGSGPKGRIIERDIQAALADRQRLTPLAQSMVEKGDFVAPPRGSGPGGRVTAKDLQAVAAQPTAQAPADAVEEIPVRGVRKVIAERMLESLQTTAQLTLNASADARALLAYRKRLKASDEALGLQKVTINDLILFAVSRTLPQYPEMNALFQGDTIYRHRNVQLAFAVDTPRDLIVPVIANANTLSLKQLSAEARRLAAASLEGKVLPDELEGGTFTVTNLGALGIEDFTPVLNPPQVGILGVGNINLKPVQVGEDVEFLPHIGLSLTINHQVVDGAPGARFLQTLAQYIGQLELLLAL